MLKDLSRTLAQLTDRPLIRVLGVSLVLALILYAALVVVAAWAISYLSVFDINWLDSIIRFLGSLAVALIALLLFPSFAMAIQGLLLEDVALAVESRHYPDLPPPRPQSWGELAIGTGRLVALAATVNLLMLPLYLALIFVPPLNLLLFYVVNGWLLGREYFETVALRRLTPKEVGGVRKTHQAYVWLTGAVIAFLFTIPVLNLFVPVIGTALMLHRFERLRARGGAQRDGVAAGRILTTGALALMASAAVLAAHAPDRGGYFDRRAVAARFDGTGAAPDPAELIGLEAAEVEKRLGSPELVRREAGARVWQYTSSSCVLDLFLYEEGGAFRVEYLKTRARRPEREAGKWCYAGIIAASQPALGGSPVSAQR